MKKINKNRGGFTLTEVMIGIMILTIAIVSASNLLGGLVRANRTSVSTLQAYYFAQEGLEAVRNIRDSNWLLNYNYLDGELFGALETGVSYGIFLDQKGWSQSVKLPGLNEERLKATFLPWEVRGAVVTENLDPFSDQFALTLDESTGASFYTNSGDLSDAKFYRHIDFQSACEIESEECEAVLVRSVVNWREGSNERELVLENVLTNWKDGAL